MLQTTSFTQDSAVETKAELLMTASHYTEERSGCESTLPVCTYTDQLAFVILQD